MASSPIRRATFSAEGSSIIDRALGGRSSGPIKASSARIISCDRRRRENSAQTSASSSCMRRGKLDAPECVVFSAAPQERREGTPCHGMLHPCTSAAALLTEVDEGAESCDGSAHGNAGLSHGAEEREKLRGGQATAAVRSVESAPPRGMAR